MKKILSLLMFMTIILALLSGCTTRGSNESVNESIAAMPTSLVTNSSTTPVAEADSTTAFIAQTVDPQEATNDNEIAPEVDIDLTVLSSTMIFGEVFNMTMEPDSYIGKTVKMRGQYSASYLEEGDKLYHFVVILDATACCAQGLEFVWTGDHVYPEDYPVNKSLIEIIGVWEKYEEDGQVWYRIRTEEIIVF